MKTNTSGIYAIVNSSNGKRYIGSAVRINYRWNVHRCRLRNRTHHCPHLQSAWNRYGECTFEFVVILNCGINDLIKKEQEEIDKYQSTDRRYGYNAARIAGSSLGVIRSAETRARISASKTGKTIASKGRPLSVEHKKSLALANVGKKATDETRQKMSESMSLRSRELRDVVAEKCRGKKRSADVRAKMSEIAKERAKSDEYRAKLSAANTGRSLTSEHRHKLSLAHKGVPLSALHRKRLSEVRKGTKRSTETRERMAIAQRLRWERTRLNGSTETR